MFFFYPYIRGTSVLRLVSLQVYKQDKQVGVKDLGFYKGIL